MIMKMKVTKQYSPVVPFIIPYRVLTFYSLEEIPKCSTVCYVAQGGFQSVDEPLQ